MFSFAVSLTNIKKKFVQHWFQYTYHHVAPDKKRVIVHRIKACIVLKATRYAVCKLSGVDVMVIWW